MTGIEISLLIIGCIFMLGSFFVSEKLSTAEIDRIADLSDAELKRIIEKGMEKAGSQIDLTVDDKVEEASEKVEIAMEKESNLKIMAIKEYSDTIFEDMKKTHEEIMFLYSMLNDKHTELTSLTGNLQRLAADIRSLQEGIQNSNNAQKVKKTEQDKPTVTEKGIAEDTSQNAENKVTESDAFELEEISTLENHNERILELYREGLSKIEIAKQLNLGVGEVSLVIGLYKGEE